jgi:hypothetical protein
MNDFFLKEINWIGDRIREETNSFPDSVRPLAERFTTKRLIFSADEDGFVRLDPTLGFPTRNFIPVIVFWIADSFGLKDREISKRLALGLVYSSLAFAVLDDTIEEKKSPPSHLALANMYLHRYMQSFDGIFESDSGFWHFLSTSIKNFNLLIYRDFLFNHEPKQIESIEPLSESFLFESCKSYSTLVMTTFAAVAYASNNESKIPQLSKFWTDYATGHRIYDDLNDLYKDMRMSDYNNSSVLLYALKKANKNELTEELVHSMLMDPEFIEEIYSKMLGYFKRAKNNASVLNSSYLNEFMDELINTHKRKKEVLKKIGSDFFKELEKIITNT